MVLKLKICAYFAVTSSFPIKLFQTCSPFSCLSVSDCNPEGIFANCLLFYRIFVSMLRAIQALSFNVLCFTNNLYKCSALHASVSMCQGAWKWQHLFLLPVCAKHVHPQGRVNIFAIFSKKEFSAYFASLKTL